MTAESLIDRYRAALGRHLPPGVAFTRAPEMGIDGILEWLAVELARVHERVADLLREFLPSRADELLNAWEGALGLVPHPFPGSTTEERQAIVAGRLTASLGTTEADLRAIAASMGYAPLTFTRAHPLRVGSVVGDALSGGAWPHTVLIGHAAGATDDALHDALRRARRAHATYIFQVEVFPTPLLMDGDVVLMDGDVVLL